MGEVVQVGLMVPAIPCILAQAFNSNILTIGGRWEEILGVFLTKWGGGAYILYSLFFS